VGWRLGARNWEEEDLCDSAVAQERTQQINAYRAFSLGMTICSVLCLVTVVLTILVVYNAVRPPGLNAYISDGELFTRRVTPLLNRRPTTPEAKQWVKESVAELMSLHFRTLREDLPRRRELFTAGGYEAYVASLSKMGVIDQVREQGLVITAVNKTEPLMDKGAIVRGKAVWIFVFDVIQTVQGAASEHSTRVLTARAKVEQVDRKAAAVGLKISVLDLS